METLKYNTQISETGKKKYTEKKAAFSCVDV